MIRFGIRSVDVCWQKRDVIQSNANSMVTNMESNLDRNSWRKFLDRIMSGNEEPDRAVGVGTRLQACLSTATGLYDVDKNKFTFTSQ